MFTKVELLDAVNEILAGKHSVQNCEKLAAIYSVLDHLYPEEQISALRGYSGDAQPQEVESHGDSEFLQEVSGKNQHDAWILMNELMDTLQVVSPRIYSGVMRKLSELN